MQLENKKVVIIGGSRGVGRVIAQTAHGEGAKVLVVARNGDSLEEIAREIPGVQTLQTDATEEEAPDAVFRTLRPDVLVLCGGAIPVMAPIHEQTWDDFSRNWNADVRASFLFCRAALRLPLDPGSVVILISSGAAVGGSPISGGYAGAKRMQMFMADYCQSESDRGHLNLRFVALAPGRIMQETELGKAAVAGYAARLGIPEADFIQGMEFAPAPGDIADALIKIVAAPNARTGNVFIVSSKARSLTEHHDGPRRISGVVGTTSERPASALLSDAGIAPRRRGLRSGNLLARVGELRSVRGLWARA